MDDQRLLLLQRISETSLRGELQSLIALSEKLNEMTVSDEEDPEVLRGLQQAARRAASLLIAAQEGVASTRTLLENLLGRGRVNSYDSSGRIEKVVAGEAAPLQRL